LHAGLYYPLGTIATVPRAYEGMERRTNKTKDIKKYENLIQNPNSKTFFSKTKIPL
jgi:hypothetical protein